MGLIIHPRTLPPLGAEIFDAWRDVPTSIVSDELNRFGTVGHGVAPVRPDAAFVGEALTARVKAGDNAALHYAAAEIWPGAALMVDAGGYVETAVWGGILHRFALRQGAAGVVVDGAIRDVAELRASALPAYARGAVPQGPHKGWGGDVNGPIQCGGCPVMPGDLVIGDADGVVVIPRAMIESLLPRCRARMAMEAAVEAGIDQGKSTLELLKFPKAADFK